MAADVVDLDKTLEPIKILYCLFISSSHPSAVVSSYYIRVHPSHGSYHTYRKLKALFMLYQVFYFENETKEIPNPMKMKNIDV